MKSHLLTKVFQRLRPRLLDTARQISGSDADALDALQDAFCRLWSRRDKLQGATHAEGASVIAVRNAAIDSLRRRRLTTDIDPLLQAELTTDDCTQSSDELYAEVEQIIARELSERDRTILYLRDRNEYDIEAIANHLGLTEANVRVILSRARRTVRDCYRRQINNITTPSNRQK